MILRRTDPVPAVRFLAREMKSESQMGCLEWPSALWLHEPFTAEDRSTHNLLNACWTVFFNDALSRDSPK
jgi:hypothetical protein